MKKAMKQSRMMLLLNTCSVVILAVALAAVGLIVRQSAVTQRVNEERYELTLNANRFMNGSAYLTSEVQSYAVTGRQEHYDNYWNEINNLKNRDIGVQNMKEIGITAAEQEKVDAMSALSNKLVPLEEQAMKDVALGNLEAAAEAVFGLDYDTQIQKIAAIKTEFLDMLSERTTASVQAAQNTTNTLMTLVVSLMIAVGIMQGVTFLMMSRKVLRPIMAVQLEMENIAGGNLNGTFTLEPDTSEIGRMVGAMVQTKQSLNRYIDDISTKLSQLAQGNMDQQVEMDYIGDYAPIKDSLIQIMDSLNTTLLQIRESSHQVSSGANQVASGAQALAQGATEQASSVEELSATITDISQQVYNNTANAVSVQQKVEEVGESVLQSNHHMQELSQAMENISSASQQIGKIIKTIEDIAFQTNILALNAAVEAARAGAAGKGFAVVADEVRNLASKSAEAAKNTATLITDSVKAVEQGTQLAVDAAQSLTLVVDGADDIRQRVTEITGASASQSDALKQVTLGVEEISSVVQTNSATAEESAAAAQELSGQAQILQELVTQFTLREWKGNTISL